MNDDITTSFLTYYIRSLAERTRVEKATTKFGFDWIIYNLALATDLIPYRLPFLRSGPTEISKTKTEPEFGIDCSFLSADGRTLTIFVLKDEVLCNKTWVTNDFDSDLRKAATPDLSHPEFKNVDQVRIILAYNKDEDQAGIQLYTNLTKALGTRIGDGVSLSFERWNLSSITELVRTKLLSPSLLPQRFFSHFSYICSQFGDFRHQSDEWENQLIPNWRHFLTDVLKDETDERTIRVLPVALIVLREHGGNNPSAETGWIDLTEWAMLAAWQVFRSTKKTEVKDAVLQMWLGFYLAEIERYYKARARELAVQDSLVIRGANSYLETIASSVIAFWHIARLGILAVGYYEFLPSQTTEERNSKSEALNSVANWLVSLINANPSAQRPLLDINHIELFLIWRTLFQISRYDDIYHWLQELESRLFLRRAGTAALPFIDGGNSLNLVLEFVAAKQKPQEFCDESSLLVLTLIEFCFSLEPKKRAQLIGLFYKQLVLGMGADGKQIEDYRPLELMGWTPPKDWVEHVLSRNLAGEGESQTIGPSEIAMDADDSVIAAEIENFIREVRSARKFELPDGLPAAVIILACLKHRSPLPPEFWRGSIFESTAVPSGPGSDEAKSL